MTHVVFAWREIDRLRGTYGFPEVVTRGWVSDLAQSGLRLVDDEPRASVVPPLEIYEIAEGDPLRSP